VILSEGDRETGRGGSWVEKFFVCGWVLSVCVLGFVFGLGVVLGLV